MTFRNRNKTKQKNIINKLCIILLNLLNKAPSENRTRDLQFSRIYINIFYYAILGQLFMLDKCDDHCEQIIIKSHIQTRPFEYMSNPSVKIIILHYPNINPKIQD